MARQTVGRPTIGKRKRPNASRPTRGAKRRSAVGVYEDADADERSERRLQQRADLEGLDLQEDGAQTIDQEDDEEIDEDAAFDEDDEERFGVFFEGKDASEGASEEDSEADSDDEEAFSEDAEDGPEEGLRSVDSGSVSGEGHESEGEAGLEDLSSYIASLPTSQGRRRRERQAEVTLPFPEDPANLPIARAPALAEMLEPLRHLPGLAALRKQAAQLEKHKAKEGPLPAPLHTRAKDRANRQAARELAVKEVSKWTPIVKRNREAEVLQFPLNEPARDNNTSAALTSNFKPATDLEKEVAAALKDIGLGEDELAKAEELELNAVTEEEVKARRAELAKLRSLLFFQEAKMKKAAKIKSRAYRKIRKKEKEAASNRIRELELLDPARAAEERQKAEVERARERATMRHKNTSKWARAATGRPGTREQVEDQLRKHEALMRKIEGKEDSDRESDEVSDLGDVQDASDGEEGTERARARALEELDALESDLVENVPQKGLMALKFMQRAAKEQQDLVRRELDAVRDELLESEAEEDGAGEQELSGGRRSFAKAGNKAPVARASEDADDAAILKPAGKGSTTRMSGPVAVPFAGSKGTADGSNPWLDAAARSVRRAGKDVAARGRQEKAADGLARERKRALKAAEEDETEDHGIIDASMDLVLPNGKTSKVEGERQRKAAPAASGQPNRELPGPAYAVQDADLDAREDLDADGSEAEESGDGFQPVADLGSMTQRELMALAFATDDVAAEFEEEKRQLDAESDADEDGGVLPGWGSWGGKGVKARPKKPVTNPKVKPLKPARKDAALKHVIINERKPKKALKYATEAVPFPFKTKEQYEASLRMPLGKEWNTATAHQRNIVPNVIVKSGTIIHPLKYTKRPA
ncbi:small-subunit processome [Hyaloraphidium curvatum]|nr:small-subunit processome [Hyaloraphidium curvatum]